ncbi:MAG: hypothetical protein RLQ73_00715 [Hoeflea sp. D1-CHI-28]
MSDLAEMKEQLAKLRAKRADGIAGYEIDGRSMTFRRDSEIASAIADLEARIANAEGSNVRKVRIQSSKGLS